MKKLVLFAVIACAIGAYFLFDLGQYFNLAYLKAQQDQLNAFYEANRALTIALYMLIYIVMAALSLPGAAIMTLAGGAVFGLATGLVAVSFASTIGATLAFLVARFLFQDSLQQRFPRQLDAINNGIHRDGAFYLFTLRLVPLFPFFVINLLMGLTGLRVWTFYWVSQVGMLAGTAVYVNAGTQLAQIDSLSGIASPTLLLSFALIGVFPLVANKLVQWLKRRSSEAKSVKQG
ncbi:TVP38/TMEM64 family protein [Salinispirillum sp. LH 10-3-1]|uniref:TVP38/TMEM64 family membrane protein n=1 Tax=Salinispirillum sp. LH 10-3-1 TaxID=2952525 RepID=A0AB38YG87_9GAMM